jgi:uroporphyrinogen decarboxylase
MTTTPMTSMQRVVTTLGHQEPDRVPLFLLPTMHGAKELGLSVKDYFARPEHVAEGQLRLRAKYRHDCLSGLFYAALEVEALGGEVLYRDDGPPNSGEPVIRRPEDILTLTMPRVAGSPILQKVLRAIEIMKNRVGDEVPIIGVVMSPFSLPVMQLGFDRYLDIMYERKDLFARLMLVNEEFCVEWANAQLAAGATAICYFDPVSSPTIIPPELFLKTGYLVSKRMVSRFAGPTAMHLASGTCLSILGSIVQAGMAIVGVSSFEDLAELKAAAAGKITLLGNLNGIEMRRWTSEQAEASVKQAIAAAGAGGGFILSDNHGEIPLQVPEEVMLAITDAVERWGQYPLRWTQSLEQ